MVPFTPKPIRTLILLDPAHGGTDTGAHLPNNLLEKDITLAFNNRLRALLSTDNFAVISTRTSDSGTVFTTDQRAEIANHYHPALCLILHATSSGSGIHLFTSNLTPPVHPSHILPWDTAQAAAVPDSRLIANQIGVALLQAKLPVILGQAALPPLDNLTCPAVAIELAPLRDTDSDPTPVSDATYQQHAAEAIAAALTQWRTENTPDGAAQ
jgi:N-acetylmuramoyl-L-alanine amidase